ncbi:probable cytochrome P450 28c1 [Thrips palmi]|uniref:Probable cytochrome P450 28c1 n=1 Tax=Thrips palmi TaxID=161013 RepID=A0A6P8ZKM9_THRPL|nr:probable cytochrome P450 28c1 [Thrips palmi]
MIPSRDVTQNETEVAAAALAVLTEYTPPPPPDPILDLLEKDDDHGVITKFNVFSIRNIYLDYLAAETLRHYPPLDAARRMCTKTTTLRDPSGSSPPVTLQPGDLVYVPVDALHRDPAFYSHPDQFRPEHFSAEEVEKRHKCAFQGFGDGPRQCPGMRYAMQQVKVALASVLLRFEVTAGPEQVLPVERDPEAGILGFKGGVWLRFRALP